MKIKWQTSLLGGKLNEKLTSPFSRAAPSDPAATKSL